MTSTADGVPPGGIIPPAAHEIRTQRTPNPNALKYLLSVDVKASGKVSYNELAQCPHVPLAQALLGLANVTQVHFFENAITVTQNGASDWSYLDPVVQDLIKRWVPTHDAHFSDSVDAQPAVDRGSLPKEIIMIEEILDRTVRPSLQADGGDLEVVELDGNILTVRFQGACGGCPSAFMGTMQAIESILREEFNPYLEIVTV